MTSKFLPFALPDIGEEEIAEVVESLRSGWVTTGPKAKQFEQDFAAFLGDGLYALAVNSATAGMHLALEALGIGPGDEVITSAYTYTATPVVARYLGAEVVLVDIDPRTFNLDPDKVAAAITPRTKAIMPVHIAGLACDMDAILQLAARHNLSVVEDAAHAFPTTYKGRLIGSLDSAATVFSFYATKTITTGEGGMLILRDPGLARRCRSMRLHGFDRNVFDRYTSPKAAWYYEVVAPGYSYNLTDIAAALGIQQLRKARAFHSKRQQMAERYNAAFQNLPVVLPAGPPAGDTHAWHLYMLRLRADARLSRDDFIAKMQELGISCSVHFIPIHLHPYWRSLYHYQPGDFPAALAAYEQEVSLPLFTKMTEDDQARVIEAVTGLLG